jgi:hypothetical protein
MTQAALVAEQVRWVNGLAPGTYVTTDKLARDHLVWLGPPHTPVAPGDQVDGIFVIHAKDLAAAQQIAATNPHLKHGGRIEVHEIDRTPAPDTGNYGFPTTGRAVHR